VAIRGIEECQNDYQGGGRGRLKWVAKVDERVRKKGKAGETSHGGKGKREFITVARQDGTNARRASGTACWGKGGRGSQWKK